MALSAALLKEENDQYKLMLGESTRMGRGVGYSSSRDFDRWRVIIFAVLITRAVFPPTLLAKERGDFSEGNMY
jgi:hypothetical protein